MTARLSTLRGALLPIGLLIVWNSPAAPACSRRWSCRRRAPSRCAGSNSLVPALPHDPASQSYMSWLLSGELPARRGGEPRRVLAGFAIGAGLALPVGLLMGTSDRLYALTNPLLQILRPIRDRLHSAGDRVVRPRQPAGAVPDRAGHLLPRPGQHHRGGVRQVDSIYIRRRAQPRRQPVDAVPPGDPAGGEPFVLAGMRIGIGTAFIVVIVAEMIAVSDGLGYRILERGNTCGPTRSSAGCDHRRARLLIDSAMSRLNDHLCAGTAAWSADP